MQRILFLDVDGVLNCDEDFQGPSNSLALLNANCVDRLSQIVKNGKISLVVLSSAWRQSGEGSLYLTRLRKVLRAYGIEIHDKTPVLYSKPRGVEISEWLSLNFFMIQSPKIKLLILDDHNDMLSWQKKFFVQTKMSDGLTDQDVIKALDVLENKEITIKELKTLCNENFEII